MTPVLEAIVALIVRCCDPDEIVLFGSQAKGTTHGASDIDLLVVGDFKRSRYLRAQEVDDLVSQFPVAVDLHLMTREELAVEIAQPFSFFPSILVHGVTLHKKRGASDHAACVPAGAEI